MKIYAHKYVRFKDVSGKTWIMPKQSWAEMPQIIGDALMHANQGHTCDVTGEEDPLKHAHPWDYYNTMVAPAMEINLLQMSRSARYALKDAMRRSPMVRQAVKGVDFSKGK